MQCAFYVCSPKNTPYPAILWKIWWKSHPVLVKIYGIYGIYSIKLIVATLSAHRKFSTFSGELGVAGGKVARAIIGSIYNVKMIESCSCCWIFPNLLPLYQHLIRLYKTFQFIFSRGSFTKRIFAYFEGHLSHSRQQQKLFSLSQEIKKGKYEAQSFLNKKKCKTKCQ